MAAQRLANLPDDVLDIIGKILSLAEICTLNKSCKTLNEDGVFDRIWLMKCEELDVLPYTDLVEWRKGFVSYKALFKFLMRVKPLLGDWGNEILKENVVYMFGYASVIGCRVSPQKKGPIRWAPVFEIISDSNGAPFFLLHGRENCRNYIYPGTVMLLENGFNALLLEVETKWTNKRQNRKQYKIGKTFMELPCRVGAQWLQRVCHKIRVEVPDKNGLQNEVAYSFEPREALLKLFHEDTSQHPLQQFVT